MTNFLAIFKLDLLMSFKLSNGDKRKLAKKIGLIVLLLVAFAVPLGGVLIMLYFLSQAAVFGGYLDEILNLIFLTVQLAILIFFLPSYINTVWFSKDRQLLSSMPIGSTAVFVSRMLTIYLSALIISVLVTLTGGAVVAAGSASASETYAELIAQGLLTPTAQAEVYAGAGYYLMLFFTALTLPVIPMFVMAALSFPLMKIISYFKRNSVVKTVLMLIIYGAFFALIYVGSFYLQNSMQNIAIDGSENSFDMLSELLEMMCGFTRNVYPSYFAAEAMCGSWQGGLCYAAVIVGCAALTLIGSKFFFTLADTRAVINTGKKNSAESEVKIKSTGVKLALMKKDIICLMREPQLAFQSLAGIVLAPIVLLVLNIMLPMGAAEGTEDMYPLMNGAMSLLMLILFTCGTNLLASIAVSREGRSFKIMRFMPISCKDIIIAKLLLADIFSFICTLINCIVLISLSVFNAVDFFGALISVTLINMGVNAYALGRDIKAPKFDYNTVRELVKSSSKTLSSMLVSLAVSIACVAAYVGIILAMGRNYASSGAIWGAVLGISIIVFAIFRYKCISRMSKAMDVIE